jgi:ATP-dependent DNA helicase DinG
LAYISNGSEEQYYEIEELVKASKGNAFVLFTSYRDMRDFYSRVDIPYPKLIQGDGISRANLLKEFRKIENAVLFATKSFWEGVDVQGDDLVLVIIHKIPFGNPSDLLYKSRIEKVDEKLGKGKHWIRYTIPDACLKLKQGAGRLIRNKTDRGVIALLDARVNYRNYGKAVVNSLPPAPRTQSLNKVRGFYRERGI